MNLLLAGIRPSLGFGIASASLVGQALGRKDPKDARRWSWDVVRLALLSTSAVFLPLLVLPDATVGLFLRDTSTQSLAVTPLMLIAASMPLDCIGIVMMQSLMGAGATRVTFRVSVAVQWLLLIPGVVLAGPMLGLGLVGVWSVFLGCRVLQALVFVGIWQRGAWARIQI